MQSRIMYIECNDANLNGPARIGRVEYSKTGKTIYYGGKTFQSLKGGYKANFYDLATGEEYWISCCRKDGADRLYASNLPIDINADTREEYWTEIRKLPQNAMRTQA